MLHLLDRYYLVSMAGYVLVASYGSYILLRYGARIGALGNIGLSIHWVSYTHFLSKQAEVYMAEQQTPLED